MTSAWLAEVITSLLYRWIPLLKKTFTDDIAAYVAVRKEYLTGKLFSFKFIKFIKFITIRVVD